MLPTLNGRIQTRIFATLIIGGIWTLIIGPLLPSGASLSETYKAAFIVLIAVCVLGIAWEIVYHGVMQFRWEKDWPTLFGFLNGINEGVLLWILLAAGVVPGHPKVNGPSFLIQFITTWLVIWVMVNGPMRVPFVRWRFNGGRLV